MVSLRLKTQSYKKWIFKWIFKSIHHFSVLLPPLISCLFSAYLLISLLNPLQKNLLKVLSNQIMSLSWNSFPLLLEEILSSLSLFPTSPTWSGSDSPFQNSSYTTLPSLGFLPHFLPVPLNVQALSHIQGPLHLLSYYLKSSSTNTLNN